MKNILVILVLSLLFLSAYSQESTAKLRAYRAAVLDSSEKSSKGYIASLNDTSIIIAPTVALSKMGDASDKKLTRFHYTNIRQIEIKRKGGPGRGALYGALIGAGIGIVAGIAEGDDPPIPPDQDFFGLGNAFRLSAGEKAGIYGTGGFLAGGLIGCVIGAVVHKKFIIGGKKEKFVKMQLSVMERLSGHPHQ